MSTISGVFLFDAAFFWLTYLFLLIMIITFDKKDFQKFGKTYALY
jgi:hypothetical protein